MAGTGKYTQAGGFILAVSIIAGTVAGVIVNQPSVGFIAGATSGVLLALLFWVNDRRRVRSAEAAADPDDAPDQIDG